MCYIILMINPTNNTLFRTYTYFQKIQTDTYTLFLFLWTLRFGVYILLGFDSVLWFILLEPHDPRVRSRRPPNDGRRPGAAPKVPGSIFMPAIRAGNFLTSFLFSIINLLRKRKTHVLTAKVITYLNIKAWVYLWAATIAINSLVLTLQSPLITIYKTCFNNL